LKLDFIRGHMGGNKIILLVGAQFPAGRELELAVKILGPNYLDGHEAGLLYPGRFGADLAVKIAEPTAPSFISACGGLTQVLGKALVETDLGERFSIPAAEPLTAVVLETGAGLANISVEVNGGKVQRVVTEMEAFVRECYGRGVGPLVLQGIPAMRVGKFLVVNGDAIRERCPGIDWAAGDSSARRILTELQKDFIKRTGELEYNYCLYDWNPQNGGDARVVFPHCLPQEFIEPSCGTGSVAVGIALLESGEMQQRLGQWVNCNRLRLEAGGGIELGGPDITELFFDLEGGSLRSVSFAHSLVEITAMGQVLL
jgi:hypothetical protein